MFNKELAEKAHAGLQKAVDEYNTAQAQLTKEATELHQLRESVGRELIGEVERFISSIADHPKQFDKTLSAFHLEFENFQGAATKTAEQLKNATVKGAAGAGLGIAAGAATAGLAPTAAIAIATTFGTASTGTAIASLSGAAATNAALAWLGGGALAAGGGGMAGGSALLALAGPIGWGIAGVAVAGGGIYYWSKNKKVAQEANAKTLTILNGVNVLKVSHAFVSKLRDQTKQHVEGLHKLLKHARGTLPQHYSQMSLEQLECIGSIINHVHTLTELMQRTVTEYLVRKEAYDRARAATRTFRVGTLAVAPKDNERAQAELLYAKKAFDAYTGRASA